MLLYRIPYNGITVTRVSIEDFVVDSLPHAGHLSFPCDIFLNKGTDRGKLCDKTLRSFIF